MPLFFRAGARPIYLKSCAIPQTRPSWHCLCILESVSKGCLVYAELNVR